MLVSYIFSVCFSPCFDLTICLFDSREGVLCREISARNVAIIRLCTTFKPVKVNPDVVIDARSAANLNTLCSFCQNYTCHLLYEDMSFKIALAIYLQVPTVFALPP